MNTRRLLVVVVVGSLVGLIAALGQACTEFRVQATDGTVVIGRSMEFQIELNWTLKVEPRGRFHCAKAPNGKDGLRWTNTYG